ncbi:MAG: hypothetical protein ACRD29_21230 [Acidimicrobiales bacterium]
MFAGWLGSLADGGQTIERLGWVVQEAAEAYRDTEAGVAAELRAEMSVPAFTGEPAALRAAASTLERLAADLRSEHTRVHAARESLGGGRPRWSGPASVAFDQSVWWLGTQVFTAFDNLERGAGTIRAEFEQAVAERAGHRRPRPAHQRPRHRGRWAFGGCECRGFAAVAAR